MENCPDCGTHRSGGWTQRTREVIDLPAAPVQVTEHIYIGPDWPREPGRAAPPAGMEHQLQEVPYEPNAT